MDARGFSRLRWPLTLAVALCYTSLLVWQQLNAGVPGHSFLAREDMPAISNWWGTLVLPALTFLTAERLRARLEKGGRDPGVGAHHTGANLGVAAAAFGGALLFGAALAVSFATGHANISALLFQSLLVIGLLLPIYRAEYVLGFVLGMTLTFGAVLPTFVATVMATLSRVLHLTVRRGFSWLMARVANRAPAA